jgi:hypothetical protein
MSANTPPQCPNCKCDLTEANQRLPYDLCDECYIDLFGDDDEADETEFGVECSACGGTGKALDNGTNMGECDECNGTGVIV